MIAVSLLLLSLVSSVAANCYAGGCGPGYCCSAYGFCGNTAAHCGTGGTGGYVAGDCRATGGCAAGYCCSAYGYCGNTAEHCGGAYNGGVNGGYNGGVNGGVNGGAGTCRTTGCPAGSCCSSYGFCGSTAAHCGGVAYNNCGYTACAPGTCCTQYGYCGAIGSYCAVAKTLVNIVPAPIEGEFQGLATYYNASRVSTQYSLCGTERARALDEGDQKIYTAALNDVQFDPYTVGGIPSKNPICDKKALVKGPKGQVIVRFVDRCGECQEGDIALTPEAFIAVSGELGTGETNVQWQFL